MFKRERRRKEGEEKERHTTDSNSSSISDTGSREEDFPRLKNRSKLTLRAQIESELIRRRKGALERPTNLIIYLYLYFDAVLNVIAFRLTCGLGERVSSNGKGGPLQLLFFCLNLLFVTLPR